jgi:hypothetical protein
VSAAEVAAFRCRGSGWGRWRALLGVAPVSVSGMSRRWAWLLWLIDCCADCGRDRFVMARRIQTGKRHHENRKRMRQGKTARRYNKQRFSKRKKSEHLRIMGYETGYMKSELPINDVFMRFI